MEDFKIAAEAFIVKDGKLLIVKRSLDNVQKPGIWEIPGGRLEPKEDPWEGVKRETREEVGIEIEVLFPINVQHFIRDDGQTVTQIIFLCKPLSDNVKLSEEHTDFEWIPIERCKEKLTKFFHEEVDIFNKLDLNRLLN